MRTVFDTATSQNAIAAAKGNVPQRNSDVPLQGASSPLSPKVVHAAHEFEASMMKELMASLEPGHDSWGGDESEDGSASSLSDFAGEALSQAISEHGGFGIADRIIRQLSSESNQSGNAAGSRRRFGTDAKESPESLE